MILYTVQPKSVYEELTNGKDFICDISKSICVETLDESDSFFRSYNWLIGKMNEVIENPDNIKYPVWAWYSYGDTGNNYPNLNNFSDTTSKDGTVMIKIEIDEKDVFLSDYDIWHGVLNNIYWNDKKTDEEWDAEEERIKKLSPEEYEKEKEESWKKVYTDLNLRNGYIQATFWKLTPDMIRSVREIKFCENVEYIMEDLDDGISLQAIFKIHKIKDLNQTINNYIENEKNTYIERNNIDDEFVLLDKNFLSDTARKNIQRLKEMMEKEIEITVERGI